jgi:hypothetical protein
MSFYHNIALSFNRNIARQNCSSDEGLKEKKMAIQKKSFNVYEKQQNRDLSGE